MKIFNIKTLLAALAVTAMISCGDDDNDVPLPNGGDLAVDFSGNYVQADQTGRPGITTVMVTSGNKDTYNENRITQNATDFESAFQQRLDDLNQLAGQNYQTNILGLDRNAFGSTLANDALQVARTGVTSYFNGTQVLTGRALEDDVIDISLTLIFGGPNGTDLAPLTSDNVDSNDKPFLNSFPYLAEPHM